MENKTGRAYGMHKKRKEIHTVLVERKDTVLNI